MKIAVVYPYVPHYRKPVFTEMWKRGRHHQYVFFAGRNIIDQSILSDLSADSFEVRETSVIAVRGLLFQFGLLRACCGGEFQGLIFLGNPYFLTTWVYAALARLFRKRVAFWTHGWLRKEAGLRGVVRNVFYRFADVLLLYGERAKSIGIASGFAEKKLHVIYNSLDYEGQTSTRASLESLPDPRIEMSSELRNVPLYVASIARLTDKCRFDLAIKALAAISPPGGPKVPLVLIGDGPARKSLEHLAASLGVPVIFAGELYTENDIGAILYNARVVVAPGKLGLTGMHSLAYGTPVITHDDFDEQMPEHEAVLPGISGAFFEKGSVEALAQAIQTFLEKPRTQLERQQCIAVIESKYTPARQVELLESAMSG